MDQYALFGNPVSHSQSPRIHQRFAELTGQRLHYGLRLVPPGGFAQSLAAFRAEGGRGCNITVPHKFDAAALATHPSERVRLSGACNTLRFDGDALYGDNTDGLGLVADITHNAGVALAGQDVLLIGGGGAAAGVVAALLACGPRHLVVANRTVDKAQHIVQRHAALAQAQGSTLLACALDAVPGAFQVLINASSSSLGGAPVPVAAAVLAPGALAYDMMYGPAAQGFMHWAGAHGAHARDGLGMLVEQAAAAFALWRGVHPPTAPVLAELRASMA